MPITSVPQPDQQSSIDATCLAQGYLPKPGWVRIDKIFSLERQAILQGLAKLGAATLMKLHAAMCQRLSYP
jgi:hypothetical protein